MNAKKLLLSLVVLLFSICMLATPRFWAPQEVPALPSEPAAVPSTPLLPAPEMLVPKPSEDPLGLIDSPQARVIRFSWAQLPECYREAEAAAEALRLTLRQEDDRGYIDTKEWIREYGALLPFPGISGQESDFSSLSCDDHYFYRWGSPLQKDQSDSLFVYDKDTKELLYRFINTDGDMGGFSKGVRLIDGVLYSVYGRNPLENDMACYLFAYDLEREELLWRSEANRANSFNFLIRDDVILCGFGATRWEDYLYQIDRNTGKTIAETPVAYKPNYLAEQDSQLFVNTHGANYIFNLE